MENLEILMRATQGKVDNFLSTLQAIRKGEAFTENPVEAEAWLTARGVVFDYWGNVQYQIPSLEEVKVAMNKIAAGADLLRITYIGMCEDSEEE